MVDPAHRGRGPQPNRMGWRTTRIVAPRTFFVTQDPAYNRRRGQHLAAAPPHPVTG